MKSYTITRMPNGEVHLLAQMQVVDKDQRGRTTGTHIDERVSKGYDIGNATAQSQSLAADIMAHYYGSDAGAMAEAARKTTAFLHAFLIHNNLPLGGKLEISSDVIDRWNSLS